MSISTSQAIENKIKALESLSERLQAISERVPKAKADSRKRKAQVAIALKNGKLFELDGESIQNPPVSIMNTITNGLCWEESFEEDQAEISLKVVLELIEINKAQLNGYQSINKHQAEV